MTPARGECPLCHETVRGAMSDGGEFLPARGLGHYNRCPYGSDTPPSLVRLRADPSKVRVGIRRVDNIWRATVEDRENGTCWISSFSDPVHAIIIALERARTSGLKGLNPDLEWVYGHPQFPRYTVVPSGTL